MELLEKLENKNQKVGTFSKPLQSSPALVEPPLESWVRFEVVKLKFLMHKKTHSNTYDLQVISMKRLV